MKPSIPCTLLLTAALSLACGSSPTQVVSQDSAAVRGAITVQSAPVEGYTVAVGDLEAMTGIDGRYELLDVPRGRQRVTFINQGFTCGYGYIDVSPPETTFDFDLSTLLPGGVSDGHSTFTSYNAPHLLQWHRNCL